MEMKDKDYNNEYDNEETDIIVTLTLDDDTTLECAVLSIFPVGDKQYIALLPLSEDDTDEEGEVYLYQFNELDNNEMELINIEDDDEYDTVIDAFDALLEEEDFDAILDDEE